MNRREKEGGFVLLITLLIVLLLVVIVFEIDFQSRADLRAAGNFRDDITAYYLALSGITLAKAGLEDDRRNSAQPTDHLGELWASTVPPLAVGAGAASGKVTDEAGKFNLNSLIDPATDTPIPWKKSQLENLFRLLTIDPILVDPIIDWIDKNSSTESNGAEDETYQALQFPYPTKNGPLNTVEEIRFIKGITPEVYHKIVPFLTVYTATGTVGINNGAININTADPIVLQSFDVEINESDLKSLLDSRPYQLGRAFQDRLPPNVRNKFRQTDFAVQSNIFSIEAHGTVSNTRKTIHAVWDRGKRQYLYFRVE